MNILIPGCCVLNEVGGSTCSVCWCGTVELLKFVGRDIKQLEIPAFATEQGTSKQLWEAPINPNMLAAPQALMAHQRSPCKPSKRSSEGINEALQRGEPWVWGWFHIAICYITSHMSTHADNIHEFCSNSCSRSRIVRFGCAPSAVHASCSGSPACRCVCMGACVGKCVYLSVCVRIPPGFLWCYWGNWMCDAH